VACPPRAADLVDGKMNSLNEKKEKQICATSKSYIIESNKRKYSKFDFFKFMISVTGNHFDMSARAPPNLATPLTYLFTPWCRVLLEKLTGLQLVKFPAFHGTRRFISALTSVRHLSLSWARPIQSIYPHPTSCRSILYYPPIYA